MPISAIVPTLNEEKSVAATLERLRAAGPETEIVLADGGSSDRTVEKARPWCNRVLVTERGRARQMNAGAAASRGEILLFVHADTLVPLGYVAEIAAALADARVVGGRFDVSLDDGRLAFQLIGRLISLRSRLTRTATGDQAIFVRRDLFERLGGFPEIELCEDLEFARRLKRLGKIACLRNTVTTSARRWQREGLARTVLRMWAIRLLYLSGAPPRLLRRFYSDCR